MRIKNIKIIGALLILYATPKIMICQQIHEIESICGICQVVEECNIQCKEDYTIPDEVEPLLKQFNFNVYGIDDNHNWSNQDHYFNITESGVVVYPFWLTSSADINGKRIKINLKAGSAYYHLDMSHIELNNVEIIIETTGTLIFKNGLTMNNSKLIVKSPFGVDIKFENSSAMLIRDNSDLRVFSGSDIVFDKTNAEWRLGEDGNTNDQSRIRFVSNDDFHVARTTKFMRYGNSQFEWSVGDVYLVGGIVLYSDHRLIEKSGPCNMFNCPWLVTASENQINVIKGEAKVGISISTGFDASGKLKPTAGPSASLTVTSDLGKLSQYRQIMHDTETNDELTSWAPSNCQDHHANWDYNFTKLVSTITCHPAGVSDGIPLTDNFGTNYRNTYEEVLDLVSDKSEILRLDPRYLVYPNPVTSFFNIVHSQRKDIVSIHLYDSTGNLVYRDESLSRPEIRVDINSKLNSGTYFILITDSDKTQVTERLIIK